MWTLIKHVRPFQTVVFFVTLPTQQNNYFEAGKALVQLRHHLHGTSSPDRLNLLNSHFRNNPNYHQLPYHFPPYNASAASFNVFQACSLQQHKPVLWGRLSRFGCWCYSETVNFPLLTPSAHASDQVHGSDVITIPVWTLIVVCSKIFL